MKKGYKYERILISWYWIIMKMMYVWMIINILVINNNVIVENINDY
jgi:hypothetical protein